MLSRSISRQQRSCPAAKLSISPALYPFEIHTTNRLFGRKDQPVREEFLTQAATLWPSPYEALDFSDLPGVRRKINEWISSQTSQRIANLLPENALTEDSRLLLINALYFKANWQHAFKPSATRPAPFHNHDATKTSVPTMHEVDFLPYAKLPGAHVVALPYVWNELQFLILLPEKRDGLAALERSLSAARLAECGKSVQATSLALALPKFHLTPPATDLAARLVSLGMTSAFDHPQGAADFSRIAPKSQTDYLKLSAVHHQTVLAVDEDGTEAAAATGFGIGAGSGRPPKPVLVRVDHPFIFAIQHRDTGLCLFLGRVTHLQ